MSKTPDVDVGAHKGYFPPRRFFEVPSNSKGGIVVFRGKQPELDELQEYFFLKGHDGTLTMPFFVRSASIESQLTAARADAEAVIRGYVGDDWPDIVDELDLPFLCDATAESDKPHPRNVELKTKLPPIAIEHLIDAIELASTVSTIASDEYSAHQNMYLCVHLGLVWQRMRLRRYEEYAISGKKFKTERERQQKDLAAKKDEAQRAFAEIRLAEPKRTKSSIYEELRDKFEVKDARTISRWINGR